VFEKDTADKTNSVPALLSSLPAIAMPNSSGDRPEAPLKQDQEVGRPPASRIAAASPSSTPLSVSAEPARALKRLSPKTGHPQRALDGSSRTTGRIRDDEQGDERLQETTAYQIRLGDAYMNLGDYDKALQSFAAASAFAPGNKEAQEKMRRARRAKRAEESVLR
jgi:tetratricopeptide (TPR) repeat protein